MENGISYVIFPAGLMFLKIGKIANIIKRRKDDHYHRYNQSYRLSDTVGSVPDSLRRACGGDSSLHSNKINHR